MENFFSERKGLVIIGLMALAILAALAFRTGFFGLIEKDLSDLPAWENMPAYTGRPLAEYREDPDEVKVFNEEQKKTIRDRISMLARELEVSPDRLEPWLDLGVLKKVIGDFEGARDAWEYASLIRPKNVASFKNLGELYWHYLPDYPRAEENFRKAIENEPRLIDSYISLSDLYRYSYAEKAGEADQPLLEGVEKNPGDISLMAYLAGYYKAVGRTADAIRWYEKVLEFDPDNREVREDLARLRQH